MAIEPTLRGPNGWLEDEEIYLLQEQYNDLIKEQKAAYSALAEDNRARERELESAQRNERIEMFRNNANMSFAVAAGLIRRTT